LKKTQDAFGGIPKAAEINSIDDLKMIKQKTSKLQKLKEM
jgi:hypothetical protein